MASWWQRGAVALAMASLLTGGMATLAASPAAADSSGMICWWRSMGYSEGSTEEMPGGTHLCVRDPVTGKGSWVPLPN